jgi:hypothetical protein
VSQVEDDKSFNKILKWAGILALIAVPVYLVLKKRKADEKDPYTDDDSNIFAAELEE